MVFSYLN